MTSPSEGRTGVLLMAYGSPASASAEDIEAYYTHIRRGHRPTHEQVEEVRRRYEAIGGVSPLVERTQAQLRGVQEALGHQFHVVLGMKHGSPMIEDAIAGLIADKYHRAVAVVLAPHYSKLSVGEYLERAHAAAGGRVSLVEVGSWHLIPGFLDLLAERVEDALAGMPDGTEVVFTAHSLPARIVELNDPYPTQVHETAEAVAGRARVARWSTAWQSAGRTDEPWLGPDIVEVIRARAAAGAPGVLVCPAGFVSDHLEVLYDLDVVAAAAAADVDIAFGRTASLNDDPWLCSALAAEIRERLE